QQATLSVQRQSGRTQQMSGGYVQDIFTPVSPPVSTVSARVDHWRNYNGHNLETTVATGLPTANPRAAIPARRATGATPRPAAGCAQEQNLGETHVRGVQTDVEYRIGSSWRVSGAYVYDEANVTDGGVANTALVGKYVPQVPLHHGTFQVAYSSSKVATIALSM